MSQTEVHTLERVRQANSSNGSLSINAKVPHISEQETTVQRKPHPNNDDIELAELTRRSGSRDAVPATGGAQGSAHEVDVNSPEVKLTAWLQYSSLCFTLFLAGWNDGTTGPLLPRMQEHYHVSTSRARAKSHPSEIFYLLDRIRNSLINIRFKYRGTFSFYLLESSVSSERLLSSVV